MEIQRHKKMRPLKGEVKSKYITRMMGSEEFRSEFPVDAVRLRIADNFYSHRHNDEFWARRAQFKTKRQAR